MSIAPGTRLGPYVIEASIGAGGMGEVYRALDSRLARLVAVKVLPETLAASPQALERFEREAHAVAALNHPNICTIHDVGEASSIRFLVMELLEGETLQRRLTRGALDLTELIDYATAVADALDAAHSRGIIHRDIKPANIFLVTHGIKILDFGLATAVLPAAGASEQPTVTADARLTGPGTTLGTVAYMSPEQLRGEPLDARTDLFSLGLVLYEMATAVPAFNGPTRAVVSAAILHDDPVAPRQLRPGLPARLQDVILKTLEKDRSVRCQTASELRADLRRLKRESDSTATHSPSSTSDAQTVTARLTRRRRGAVIAVSALALVVAGGAYTLRQQRAQPAPGSSAALLENLDIEQLTTSGNAARPAVSPDGKFVAYIQQNGVASSLWIRQTASASNVQTVAAQPGVGLLGANVTPDGDFVDFVRDEAGLQSLWRVLFLGGAPKRLIDNVASLPGWSPDGRHMAFVRAEQPRSSSLILATSDGGQERVLVEMNAPAPRFMSFGLPGAPGFPPAWSPDGRVIAVALYDDRGGALTGHVAFVTVADGSQRVVPLGQTPNGLEWLDDSSLVVSRSGEPGAPTQLWRLRFPGGELSRVSNDLSSYAGVSITADRGALVTTRTDGRMSIWAGDGTAQGAEIAPTAPFVVRIYGYGLTWAADRLIATTWSGSRPSISILAPGGVEPQEIVSRGVWPNVTSDGRTIVYSSMDIATLGSLWRADVDGRRAVRLVRDNSIFPRMTRDDRSVVFVSPPLSGGALSPWMVSLDGGPPTQIAKDRINPNSLDVSPDGKSIAFMPLSEPQIVICELPACTARQSLPPPRDLSAPLRWMPDGRAMAYVVAGNLWSLPIDGKGAPRQLTQFTDSRTIEAFEWSRDGTHLAIARTTVTNDIVLFKGLRR